MDLLSLSMQQPAAPDRAGSVDSSREHSSGRGCNAADINRQPCLELELKLSWPPDLAEPARTTTSLEGRSWCRPASDEDQATAKANNGPCNSSNDSRGRRPAAHAAPSSSEMGGPCFSGGTTSCSADEDDGRPRNGQPRKKLRLTKEQSFYLEEIFKEHTTVTPKQKLAIARRLNLQPRQVEVWFQNRRARTKLKQTEVDFEYLKRCCETLTEENRRLHRELQELRSLEPAALASHLRGQSSPAVAATTLSLCPVCKRAAVAGIGMAKKLGGNFNVQQVKQEDAVYHRRHHHHPKLASQVG